MGLLIIAGAVNGLILPIALAVILVAATKKKIVRNYHHPLWMQGDRMAGSSVNELDGIFYDP